MNIQESKIPKRAIITNSTILPNGGVLHKAIGLSLINRKQFGFYDNRISAPGTFINTRIVENINAQSVVQQAVQPTSDVDKNNDNDHLTAESVRELGWKGVKIAGMGTGGYLFTGIAKHNLGPLTEVLAGASGIKSDIGTSAIKQQLESISQAHSYFWEIAKLLIAIVTVFGLSLVVLELIYKDKRIPTAAWLAIGFINILVLSVIGYFIFEAALLNSAA